MPHQSIVTKIVVSRPGVKFESIIWDWNGTLLNDVKIAIDIINQLLTDRNLKPVTLSQYLDVFTFPVISYYEQIGFDLKNEPFEIPANQFINSYNKAVESCLLHEEVFGVLARLQKSGFRQFILSAMEQNQLERTVSESGIKGFFEDICGLDNHFAISKVENGQLLIKEKGLNPKLTLIIGDTIHDFEVAQAIGCSCLLIAHGHQSKTRLLTTGAKVLDNLMEIDL